MHSTLRRINARTLLGFTMEQLWDGLAGDFVLVFDDGEIVTNERETLYSAYAWAYHKAYPETPMLVKHHLRSVIKDKRTGANTHADLINCVFWTTYDAYKQQVPDRTALIDRLAKLSYEVSNTMYNDLTYRLEEYVTSLDILDFLQITTHAKVKAAYAVATPTQEGIDAINNAILEVMNDENDLPTNSLTKVLRSGLAKTGQTLQCLGPRGFLTDIDSNIFSTPIMRGYTQGIRSLYDSMVESRSAAKSLIFSTDPLQQSEYFSRRQQLICQNVKNLHLGDCGSQHYLNWPVRDAHYRDGIKVSDCDLKTIAGKYYLDENTNSLKVVAETDRHLIGKTLKLRSVVAGCMHPDPYGLCEICYGQTAEAVPANSNIGHITCVSMTAEVGQNILSTKHFDGSSVVEGIVLRPSDRKYLTSAINGSSYFLNEGLKGKEVKLIINSADALGMTDVGLVSDVETLNISRVSEFDTLGIMVTDGQSEEGLSLKVSVNGRLSSMTHALLQHVKEKGYQVTKDNGSKDNNYIINMEGWDYSKPLFVLPMRHFNMSNHQSEIASMLEATVDDLTHRSDVVQPGVMLIEFYDLVNRRLSVNLSILEVILYSSMVVSATHNDYALPKPWTTSGVGVMRMLLTKRSLSATMGYQQHRDTMVDPSSYTYKNRPDHIFDGILLPNEVFGKGHSLV